MTAWVFTHKPYVAGWYAVTVCWDCEEGMWPAAAYFDGIEWSKEYRHYDPIIARSPWPIGSKEAANEWGYANDYEEEKR